MEEDAQELSETGIKDELEDEEICSTTSDNDNHSTGSISVSVSNSIEDNAKGRVYEEGGDHGDGPTPPASMCMGMRMMPDIHYKALSGLREYNSNK